MMFPVLTGKFYNRSVEVRMPAEFDGYPVYLYKNGDTILVQVDWDGAVTGLTFNGIDIEALQNQVDNITAGPHAASHGVGQSDAVTLAQSQITGLVDTLAGKASTSHGHAESEVTGLVDDLADKVSQSVHEYYFLQKAGIDSPAFTTEIRVDQAQISRDDTTGHIQVSEGLIVDDPNTTTGVKSFTIKKTVTGEDTYSLTITFDPEYGALLAPSTPNNALGDSARLSLLGQFWVDELLLGMSDSGRIAYNDQYAGYDSGDARPALIFENTDPVLNCDIAIVTQRYIIVNGSIMPNYGSSLSLGNPTHPFRSLHLSGGIYQTPTPTSSPTYVIGDTDSHIYVTASLGNNKVVTLPLATGSGRILMVKKVDSSNATVTITADTTNTPDLIDGAATKILSSQWATVRIQDAAPNTWYII